jgi:hypothetical protein
MTERRKAASKAEPKAAPEGAPLTITDRLAQTLPGWNVCPDCGGRFHGRHRHMATDA